MVDDATQIKDEDTPPEADAAGEGKPQPKRVKRRHRKRGVIVLMASVMGSLLTFTLFLAIVALVSVMGRSVELPQWAVAQIETRLNAELHGEKIQLSTISVGLRDQAYRPTVDVTGVQIYNAEDAPLLVLPRLRSKLDTSELLLGRIKLETIELQGAILELNRDKNGQIELAFGAQMGGAQVEAGSMAEVMGQIDLWLDAPWMAEMEEVKAQELTIRLSDLRSGEVTIVEQGQLTLTNGDRVIALNISFDLDQPSGAPARLFFAADKAKGVEGARLIGKFSDLRARDLAAQVGALNFLNVLDAPASGSLTAEIDAAGQVVALAGTLDLAKGVLRPTEQAKPVPFNSAKSYLRYEAGSGRLTFDQITLDSPQLRLTATGHADLRDFDAGIPQTLLGQLRFSNVRLAPEGMFEAPVAFADGALDLRYRPTELSLDVGQLLLRNDGAEIVTSGSVNVLPEGWAVSLDAGIETIDYVRVMALWPETAAEQTRQWLIDNIQEGRLEHAHAALRVVPEKPIQAAVSFDFADAKVRFLKTLPPVEQARGYASITGNAFNLSLREGRVTAPLGGAIEAGGSVMQIPDMSAKPSVATFDLTLDGPLAATLSLLDEEPFEFLAKSGLTPDIATGAAKISTRLTVPLTKYVDVKDVGYVVSAEVRDVKSDTLIKGRSLQSDLMEVLAGDGELSIAGKGTIDGVPIDVVWSRDIGEGTGRTSLVEGTIELSPRMLETFNVGLPKGSVSGSGRAKMAVRLVKGQVPDVTLSSDLAGVGLAIPSLGWAKPQGAKGSLALDLTLGDTPNVKDVRVNVSGLDARGTVSLKPNGGGLDKAVFSPLKVAGRLNSQVEIIGRGANRQPQVVIKGGTIDIRKFGVTTGGRSTGGPPLELALDRLVVTDSISMDQFRGSFRNDKGIDGTFKASLNGKAPISGTVVPTAQGPAVRIQSSNGGNVISATGIFRNANGGDMSLTLQPNGKPGQFEGSLTVTNTRVKKAPALADLLAALSVIGLLEQLTGDGILFTNTEARFLLTPGGVTLRSSSAVGPSMGITMDGIYNTGTRRMDMRGVVSPIYAVNGLFGALFAPRKGEGLFGFNYTLKGSADGPKVGVNPLSVLTPGIFREIFRQPPPKLSN
ncbi:AsmA-like C-terminal region-containing protein [Litoreibacter janthinus]|uniref:YhdP central domain-containing protein n=1 Tax=Litoreibacter janthinus TaxID=670154 RepID=A0A1I6H0Y8_9RHOB|nr:AsmA-like C-terminal region-containing protein [Litoreibacter janthinus]SFR48136.1 Protein of unknown function [Litoreibacter janthinus]